MARKNWFVRLGDFLFKWRNYVFPSLLVPLFLFFVPPLEYFGRESIEQAKDFLALLLILAGLGFRTATIGWAYIKRGGLNKRVYADKLVSGGFFGLSRNPLYVANMVIYSGVFVLHGHPAVVVAGITLYTLIYATIIAAEEFYLANKFGPDYADYCARVPRWLPDFSNYAQATKGLSFSVVRAVAKDYSTIFNAFLTVWAIELLQRYGSDPADVFDTTTRIETGLLLVLLVAVLIIKALKMTGKLKVL